ncbi:aminotransferase class I/II-fold pyridoxal phosphate-dependent enzyme [Clostridium sp. 19966]|uniref:pyridoxal phosphate-dependent aminotransferase n=1 Tax=Clostridium sp. 19966 TaxID=2768166 RepID=UPI0028DF2D87|nr:aminotransferase class I/II-fold pyridoxal phosphate-dependent enzyme [Clostridium sp. 19966]MDT8716541.1 aminotransferase class I/II-fold pyridoxal phosphate-dependent enzyme [Clostridium sp. 19966]
MNRNLDLIEISGIRKFYNKVVEVPGALSLTIGEPDFPVPKEVKKAMIDAINNNLTKYTSNIGIEPLRESISAYLSKNKINYSKDEICITVGGSEGLFNVFQMLLNPGDKVIIPTPAYPAYESIVKLIGGNVVNCPVKEDLSLDLEALQNLIRNENAKALILSYPSNPTGNCMSKNEFDVIAKMLENENIVIISDEMYGSLCFKEYYSIAQHEKLREKTILVGGFSKMFSMTGLRIGYVCAKDEYLSQILKVHQYNVSCAPSIAQWGAYEGLNNAMYHVEHIKEELKKRRDYVYGRLIELGFDTIKPEGAFYIFPNIKKYSLNSEEFCEKLLKQAKVAAVPGSAFGIGGEGHMRISYCSGMDALVEGMNRIQNFVYTINN